MTNVHTVHLFDASDELRYALDDWLSEHAGAFGEDWVYDISWKPTRDAPESAQEPVLDEAVEKLARGLILLLGDGKTP